MKKLLSMVIVAILAGCSSMGMDMSGGSGMAGRDGSNAARYPNVNAPFDANDPYHGG